MRITFVLPGWARKPLGGFKIIYEYANRLASRGYAVTVIHPLMISAKEMQIVSRFKYIMKWIIFFLLGLRKLNWFDISKKVNVLIVPSLKERYIPTGDIIFATANSTGEWIYGYGKDKGDKFHLIQGYKKYEKGVGKTDLAWKLPLKKVVISQWLKDEVLNKGEKIYGYISNGIDFDRFHTITPIENRNPRNIGMCYDHTIWKGPKDGIQALEIVRDRFPDLNVTLFSIYKPTAKIPSWVNYFYNLPQQEILRIYNACSIFISSSWTEGWGLPASEALACGCALVTTDSGGIRDFAVNEKTALISPIKDPETLARNIIYLIENDEFRIKLAKQGNEFIRQFTWDKAIDRFEQLILSR